jgi:hypothetical protein
LSEIDLAHPALSELGPDLVPSETSVEGEWHCQPTD